MPESPRLACLVDARDPLERLFLEPYERSQLYNNGVRTDPDFLRHYLQLARDRHRALIQRGPFLAKVLRVPDFTRVDVERNPPEADD